MSSLLIQEVPLMVLPTLATKIGLNEAMFLQQLHYWIERSQHEFDGHRWVYNTVPDWCKQFPFWSERTLARILAKLEREKLILVGNYNRKGFDRTKWYTVNYERLAELEGDAADSAGDSPDGDHGAKPEETVYEKATSAPEYVAGSTILPNCQDEENQGVAASKEKEDVGGSIILPNWQDEESRGLKDNSFSAAGAGGSMTLPDCQVPSCQTGRMDDDNLARPIPENNIREVLQRTTTTLRTSQLPMEEPSTQGKMELLLLSAPDYGLSESTVQKYIREFGEALVQKEFEFLKKLIDQKKPIQNPAGWFRRALEERYEDTRANYEKIQQEKKAAADAKNQALMDYYKQKDDEERKKSLARMDESSPFYHLLKHHLKGGEAAEG